MKIITPIIDMMRVFASRVFTRRTIPQNRYEGATTFYGGDRSYIPGNIADARLDADQSTRLELVRRSRYWERNSGIARRLGDVFVQYVVGPDGLQMVPSVPDDEDWNQSAGAWWGNWSKSPEVNNSHPLGVTQHVMANAWFYDGEVFVYKTRDRATLKPRVQLIEGHRIQTPPHLRGEEGRSIVDGVEFWPDPSGRPTGKPRRYWMRTDDTLPVSSGYQPYAASSSYEPIDASLIIHLFEPTRPGMFRGLPRLYPVMNDLHDTEDLQMFEMKAAKSNADVANVMTTKTGEPNLGAMRRQKWQIQSQDAAGNPVNKQNPLYYEVSMGGRTVYVMAGEKFEQFKNERPGVSTQDYWDYLVRKICAGVGISALLVLPFSLQGTVTRADLDTAAAFFRSRSHTFAAVMREIYMWVMDWAVKYDRALDGAPAEWWHVTARPPRSVNVDVGRNSQAVISELSAGIRNWRDVCAELGHDWRQVLRQKAQEAAYINALVDEFGVTRDQIVMLGRETLTRKEEVQQTEQEIELSNPNQPTKHEEEIA